MPLSRPCRLKIGRCGCSGLAAHVLLTHAGGWDTLILSGRGSNLGLKRASHAEKGKFKFNIGGES